MPVPTTEKVPLIQKFNDIISECYECENTALHKHIVQSAFEALTLCYERLAYLKKSAEECSRRIEDTTAHLAKPYLVQALKRHYAEEQAELTKCLEAYHAEIAEIEGERYDWDALVC